MKKAQRVETFMNENEGDEENFGAWRLETLASYITALRQQLTWMLLRQKNVPPAVDAPPLVVTQGQDSTGTGADSGGCKLDNTLHPSERLSRTMSLEESTMWLSCLNAGLLSKLETDETVTADTAVRGEAGVLSKLRQYFFNDYPLMVRRHHFTECVQARGELFKVWWDKKKTKAVECALEEMKKDVVMMLELVRGVSDTMLQKKLLQEQEPTLSKLVRIVEQWQAADIVQTAFKSESSDYVRRVSKYKHQKTEKWKNEQQPNDH